MYRILHWTRIISLLTALALISGSAPAFAEDESPPAEEVEEVGRTPARLSFTDGEVSFWRPGADDWAPAQINTPVAPGDELYTGDRANLELQIGARAFVRAGADTQLGVENQEPDFLQVKVTTGHASLDLRSLTAGHTVELDTPNAAFTIERTGYYRLDVDHDSTTFITRRGGRATMIPAGGEAVGIAPSEQVVVQGADTPSVETYVTPEVDAWDRWNYERTDHLIDPISARYVSPGMYGADALDHSGTWRVVDPYGPVWVPEVAAGWTPYSTGRWAWDPYYGWTWVDYEPWGWAPYHYGRWVFTTGCWAWAPGPVVVAPVYAPALVAFFGGSHFGVSIGIGVPAVSWVALGWGEPLVPWWGHAGFVGRPWWGGWGGPRVVNNVVVNKTTIVNINNITYQNVTVNNSVIGVREDRFGRGVAEHVHLAPGDLQSLQPMRGAPAVKPVAASLVPQTGHAFRPPEAVLSRHVVATRAPHDPAPALQAQGLNVSPRVSAPAPRLVNAPRVPHSAVVSPRPPFGQQGTTERSPGGLPPRFETRQPPGPRPERGAGPRPGAPPQMRHEPAPAPAAPRVPEPRGQAPAVAPPPAAPQRQLPGEPANRVFRGFPQARQPQPHVAPSQRAPQGRPAPAPKRERERQAH